jgi:hypothetical protein
VVGGERWVVSGGLSLPQCLGGGGQANVCKTIHFHNTYGDFSEHAISDIHIYMYMFFGRVFCVFFVCSFFQSLFLVNFLSDVRTPNSVCNTLKLS